MATGQDLEQCRATVHIPHGDFMGNQCSRRAVVEVEGKGYCKAHDPVARQEKADKHYAEHQRKWAEKGQARIDLVNLLLRAEDQGFETAEKLARIRKNYL